MSPTIGWDDLEKYSLMIDVSDYWIIEINKNLKFKKGVGIAIKSKETSSKLAI